MDISKVMEKIRPGSKWTLNGDTYEGLVMADGQKKPSLNELEAAYAEYKTEQDDEALIRKEMDRILREQAIDSLVQKGTLTLSDKETLMEVKG
jgi:hypothetical protein